ncbi:MAG: anti-anti-sigma factor [Burkholderiaceae bacterium]|jgi:sigma-E factor negative regulatory protein RseA|nr:MAG: anti-anti-sigma factor [Burkholderiaceae bacterium]
MSCDREQISTLVDGQLAGRDLDLALNQMADDEACESWRMYHLIGDVMRSPDLSAAYGRRTDFMAQLRARLVAEGRVPQAPARPAEESRPDLRRSAANDQVFRWKLVAGLTSMAAVGVLGWGLLAGPGMPLRGGVQLASLATGANSRGAAVDTALNTAGGTAVLRDPELDQLLAAHRQVAGDAAFGQMAGFLHNTTFERSGR